MKNVLKNILKGVKAVVPVLAGSIGGPLGGVAVNVLAESLGLNPTDKDIEAQIAEKGIVRSGHRSPHCP